MNYPMYPGQALTGLPDDYYEYGAGSTFDDTMTPQQQESVDTIRRRVEAERWSHELADADGM